MKRYTIVIEAEGEHLEEMNRWWVRQVRREALKLGQNVFLQIQDNPNGGADLIEGKLVSFRPSRSKVDLERQEASQ